MTSSTPGPYELAKADGIVEQIIRPTGLVDPEVVLKPTKGQIDDLLHEVGVRPNSAAPVIHVLEAEQDPGPTTV